MFRPLLGSHPELFGSSVAAIANILEMKEHTRYPKRNIDCGLPLSSSIAHFAVPRPLIVLVPFTPIRIALLGAMGVTKWSLLLDIEKEDWLSIPI